ncbi:MAG: adenylate kinase [Rickettsiales bacterium]|nr:adenylate kinase [Rickettsiales bacterium]
MNVIFLGAPGSGKGTQAQMLSKELDIPQISTGDALRKEVEEQSEVGKLAKSYMDAGDLVPDEVVVNIIKNRIIEDDCQKGFVLDGFPRNIAQAQVLDSMLESLSKKIDKVFNFDVDAEILVKRITGRYTCKSCNAVYNKFFKQPKEEGVCDNCQGTEFNNRADDNEETLRSRLKVYNDLSKPLIGHYEKNNLLLNIKAVKNPPLIFEELLNAVNN